MAAATPVDREFRTQAAGFVRDKVVLANFRAGLRKLINPETGQLFTEDEIARATRPRSRWYIGAQAIDDYGQGEQRNALYMADQLRVERASTEWLVNFHGRLFNLGFLPATGGSGPATITGVPGTIVVGSTTIGDPAAYQARDPAGNVYQVFLGGTIAGNGSVVLTLAAVSTGLETNLPAGTVLNWITRDPNMQPTATVAQQFSGGTDRETNAELAARIASVMQFRPGAGNDAHFRAWAREALNAVEEGFVYPCALHAGSVSIAVTQKRAGVAGPTARIPSPATLATAIAYLTPPTSPVVPPRPFVVVTPVVSEPTDLVLRVGMPRATTGGWNDARPFPSYHATTPFVSFVGGPLVFRVTCAGDATLPGQSSGVMLSGANAPQMMVWNAVSSEWEPLDIASVEDLTGNVYEVTLNSAVSAIALNQWVSPLATRRAQMAASLVEYFDELGPGDFFDSDTDARGARCQRFPRALEEKPFRAGAAVATRVIEALGGTASDAVLASMSLTTPSYQSAIQLGPKMLTLGRAAVYEL